MGNQSDTVQLHLLSMLTMKAVYGFFLTYLIFNLSLKIHSRNYKTIGISITVYIDTLLHYFLF